MPLTPEEQPKTDEDFKAKVEEIAKAMHEAEKNNPAVTMPKPEEIEAVSLKQSQQIDSALSKAVSPPAPGAAGGGAPGIVPPPAGRCSRSGRTGGNWHCDLRLNKMMGRVLSVEQDPWRAGGSTAWIGPENGFH